MRIQLIHPPIYVNPRAVQATRPSLPLGLAYIAAALREAGHEVSVLDAVQEKPDQLSNDGDLQYFGLGPEEIADALDADADAYGITVLFSFAWPLARKIISTIKARHPETPVVAGGEHISGMPAYSLASAPLDYIILGEGEDTAVEFFTALEKGEGAETVPGIAFLRDGEMVMTPPRKRIRDVDRLPWPAWDLFDPKGYYEHGHVMGVDTGMTMPIMATRGCPYACTYCSNPMMWRRRWYARDPVNVVDEIEHYYRTYGATNFPFHDLTAILRKSWILDFCRELEKRCLPITWQLPGGTRCEVGDEEVAARLKATGCHSLTFAAESGSERTRKLIGKQLDEEQLLRAVKATAREGLNVSCFFVLGFPHDTIEDLKESVRLVKRLAAAGLNDICLSHFFPIPGTKLYDDLVESGRIEEDESALLAPIYSMDAVLSEELNYCEDLSAAELTRMKYRILLTFYATSFLLRPFRIFQIFWNVLRGHESCKLDIFLIARKRRLLARLFPKKDNE